MQTLKEDNIKEMKTYIIERFQTIDEKATLKYFKYCPNYFMFLVQFTLSNGSHFGRIVLISNVYLDSFWNSVEDAVHALLIYN